MAAVTTDLESVALAVTSDLTTDEIGTLVTYVNLIKAGMVRVQSPPSPAASSTSTTKSKAAASKDDDDPF